MKACPGLSGERYEAFIVGRVNCNQGGSAALVIQAKLARKLFPYKSWIKKKVKGPREVIDLDADSEPDAGDNGDEGAHNMDVDVSSEGVYETDADDEDEVIEVPAPITEGLRPPVSQDGNTNVHFHAFTETETRLLNEQINSWKKFFIDGVGAAKVVRSSTCSLRIQVGVELCTLCAALKKDDDGFQSQVRKVCEILFSAFPNAHLAAQAKAKAEEYTKSSPQEQADIDRRRIRKTSTLYLKQDALRLEELLKDPVTRRMHKKMLKGDPGAVFMDLYDEAAVRSRQIHLLMHPDPCYRRAIWPRVNCS
jgi:hypothetical protein